ncbi:unnamed protein product [Brassicogethes aeneus]|uniref:Uncharacterized protein n=1 Tax=Brassicogethes aeneus TaxID=1431903 RepID=A0A9P0FL22_BRAAE|nr:unnamed protein product [Brassicogethes aeneus]
MKVLDEDQFFKFTRITALEKYMTLYFYICELHLLLGVVNTLMKQMMLNFSEDADKWIKACNVQRDHRGPSFKGSGSGVPSHSDWQNAWHKEKFSRCRETLIRHLYWACDKDIYRLTKRTDEGYKKYYNKEDYRPALINTIVTTNLVEPRLHQTVRTVRKKIREILCKFTLITKMTQSTIIERLVDLPVRKIDLNYLSGPV